MKRIITIFSCLLFGQSLFAQTPFHLQAGHPITVACDKSESAVVQTALELLSRDCRTVFSSSIVTDTKKGDIVIGTVGKSPLIAACGVDVSALKGKKQAFLVAVSPTGKLVVAGSDKHGTAYGIMEICRLIGVSPWEWWADATPEKRQSFSLPAGFRTVQSPSVEYRGIFLNDEDWGLTPWSSQTYEPDLPLVGKTQGAIGPKTYSGIFELLLRLRANTIWPAMHECTAPFYFVKGNKEIADKYGIAVGTSHCEPLVRNSAVEWDIAGKGDYNYATNKNAVLSYWEERVKELKGSDNIYTIGMRGKHDGMMQGVKAEDIETHKYYLTQIIQDQQTLLGKYNQDVSKITQTFIPYKEVLEVYDAGLEVPDYITLVWCDDNYGYIRRLSNEKEQQRSGRSGVYYHVSYWGKPHDYLWLASTSPALIYTEMKRAYDHGADKLWVLNVGDIKPAEYLTEFFLDMAWNIRFCEQDGKEQSVFNHLRQWAKREFGETCGDSVASIMKGYYRLANFRKPEHSGWSKVEEWGLYDNRYGLTPVKDADYNPEFNNELTRRINDYSNLQKQVNQLKKQIPVGKQSAFFELVEYPVEGAALINQKWLYAQLARYYTYIDLKKAKNYAEKSMQAYDDIEKITTTYNRLENGKWNRIMDFKPRNLPVFDKPVFKQLDSLLNVNYIADKQSVELNTKQVIAQNAKNAINIQNQTKIVEGLGHSFAAVQMAQGDSLSFVFNIEKAGPGIIKLGMIPNHDVDGLGTKVALYVDGKELHVADYSVEGRSETWKENVLRGQAIIAVPYHFRQNENTIITVKAFTSHVILDQIMVNQSEGVKFYEFPVNM